MKNKNDNEKDYLIIISLIVSIIIIGAWLITYYSLKDLKPNERGTFGDMFGSVNAIFSGLALAGIILTILLQKKELRLQRQELHQTRIEFLLNRTTTLAYNQLERFEATIKDFEISYKGNYYKGYKAIVKLDKIHEEYYYNDEKSPQENEQTKIDLNAKYSKVLNGNKDEIERFSYNIYNSVQTLESIIYQSNLEIEDLNSIKNIFFENIGFITMGVIRNIVKNAKEQLEIFKPHHFRNYGLNVGEMQESIIFLEPINDFYNIKLTEQNFHDLKKKWKSEKGNNY